MHARSRARPRPRRSRGARPTRGSSCRSRRARTRDAFEDAHASPRPRRSCRSRCCTATRATRCAPRTSRSSRRARRRSKRRWRGCPHVIFYRVSAVTARIVARKLLLPYVGLPNVLAGRFVVPELLQDRRDAAQSRAGGAQSVRRHGDAARGSRRCSRRFANALRADTGAARRLRRSLRELRSGQRVAECCMLIAGIDEAGRGPLAGPVVRRRGDPRPGAAHPRPARFEGADARAARAARRRDSREGDRVGGRVEPTSARSTRINILQATLLAMRRAVEALSIAADRGAGRRQSLPGARVSRCTRSSRAIATSRRSRRRRSSRRPRATRCCVELDREYPRYGFAQNKGYGTPEHLAALDLHGPCPQHRRSFAPVLQASFAF